MPVPAALEEEFGSLQLNRLIEGVWDPSWRTMRLASPPPVVVLVPLFDEMPVVEEVDPMQLRYGSKGISGNSDIGWIEYLLLNLSVDTLWLPLPCAEIRRGDATGLVLGLLPVGSRVHQDRRTAVFNKEIEAVGLCLRRYRWTGVKYFFSGDTFCLEAYFLCS
jgi:hypothetical protein